MIKSFLHFGAKMSTNIVKLKKTRSLNSKQQSFNRLKKRLELLQKEESNTIKELDLALKFYKDCIYVEEEKFIQCLIERTKIVHDFFKTKNWFNNDEKQVLKELLLGDIYHIFDSKDSEDVPAEIHQIYKDLEGIAIADRKAEDFQKMKEDITQEFKEFGLDMDLSDIKAFDKEHDMLAKLFGSFHKAMEGKEEDLFKKPKNKKQIQMEDKHKIYEEIEKKNLNNIYKQLVKVLHPDLEPDLQKKKEKEEMMKKLTTAYENKDLYTLLDLETKFLFSDNKLKPDEQIKIYNEMLKNQIAALEQKIDMLFLSPNYFPIQRFFPIKYTGMNTLYFFYSQTIEDRKNIQKLIEGLKSSEAKQIIKNVIKTSKKKNDIFKF